MVAVFNGIITGLLLSVFVGATFFMLIETSMTRGFKAALWFDAGVVLCDALFITAVYFFASWINTIVKNEYFSIACGLVFMIFGANYIFSRNRNKDAVMANNKIRLMLYGFIINFMSPAVILFWLGTMAFTITKFKYTGKETIVYYTAALITMISLDVIKAYFAYRISNFFNAKVLKRIYLISGALMIGLGFWLIIQ